MACSPPHFRCPSRGTGGTASEAPLTKWRPKPGRKYRPSSGIPSSPAAPRSRSASSHGPTMAGPDLSAGSGGAGPGSAASARPARSRAGEVRGLPIAAEDGVVPCRTDRVAGALVQASGATPSGSAITTRPTTAATAASTRNARAASLGESVAPVGPAAPPPRGGLPRRVWVLEDRRRGPDAPHRLAPRRTASPADPC